MSVQDALQIIQILTSIALIVVIILQAQGQGLGGLFGGADSMGITKTRRGLEKTLFQITVGLSVAFLANAIIQLLIQKIITTAWRVGSKWLMSHLNTMGGVLRLRRTPRLF